MDLDELIARFRSDPNTRFTDAEAAILAAAAEEDVNAAKAAAFHAWRAGDHDRCLELSRKLVALRPTEEHVTNVAVTLRALNRHREALDWLAEHRGEIDPIKYSSLMSSISAYVGDIETAVKWGTETLRLRDAAAEPREAIGPPVIHRFNPDAPRRNVIAFSLWGSEPKYLRGAMTNVQLIPYLYPGWTPRFYVDASVPDQALKLLAGNGAQIIVVNNMPPDRYGMFWRMLVEDDPEVDLYLIRDADSVCNAKERWAVADWLNSGTAFHVMRDNLQHGELMLGGMWGAHRGNIGRMHARFDAFIQAARNRADRAYDQEFLRTEIWPLARHDVTVHDRWFDFGNPRRYDPAFELPASMHIGQNEAMRLELLRRRAAAQSARPDQPSESAV